jgi:hypothetical protein
VTVGVHALDDLAKPEVRRDENVSAFVDRLIELVKS